MNILAHIFASFQSSKLTMLADSTEVHCTVYKFTPLYCTLMCCTVLYCTVLYCTILNCTMHNQFNAIYSSHSGHQSLLCFNSDLWIHIALHWKIAEQQSCLCRSSRSCKLCHFKPWARYRGHISQRYVLPFYF